MEQYNIRAYKPGDGLKLSSLFTKYSPYLRDDKFWVWINRFFTQKSIVAVAECNGNIVGHYAVLPQKMQIDGINYNTGLGIHAFISPDHANNMSIFQISAYAYQIAKEQGLDFIYGFPNKNYRLIQEKIERWKKVALFNALELPNEQLLNNYDHDYYVEQIDFSNFSDFYCLNDILEQSPHNKVEITQNVSYWNNRYILHPQHPYIYLKVSIKGNIVGYFIGKYFTNNNIRYFHIVDFATYDLVVMREVLLAIFHHQSSHFDKVSCWKGDDRTNHAYRELGFQETGFDTFLGIKFLNKDVEKKISDTVLNFDNWRIVMGNSDAF